MLSQVAQAYIQYFGASGSCIECVEAIEAALDVPCVRAARIIFWFGRVKGFPGVEQLSAVAEHGAPIHVAGDTDIHAAFSLLEPSQYSISRCQYSCKKKR